MASAGGAELERMRILDALPPLVDALLGLGWRVVGPRLRDGAVVPGEVTDPLDLARGVTDALSPGRYRTEKGDPDRWFDHVVGPQGWKPWLHPPRRRLWSATRTPDGFEIEPEPEPTERLALLGVRACDIAAMDRLERALGADDPDRASERSERLVVAVQCARSADTCFCVSAGTGPRAEGGFDLALTELEGRFLVEIGGEAGAAVLARVETRAAAKVDVAEARARSEAAAQAQTRALPADAAEALRERPDHPAWGAVAARCIGCANCTMVCPTCFCTDVEDVTDLKAGTAERWQSWDSCFSLDFSWLHEGPVRRSVRSRYRQWLTHKLSSWHDQFGSSGCVGCGRCIAWCPAGIDLTQEAAALCAPPKGTA